MIKLDNKIQSTLEELNNLVKESSQGAGMRAIQQGMQNLNEAVEAAVVHVQVLHLSQNSDEDWKSLFTWLGQAEQADTLLDQIKREESPDLHLNFGPVKVQLHIHAFENVHSREVGALGDSLIICLINKEDIAAGEWQEMLSSVLTNGAWVWLIKPEEKALDSSFSNDLEEQCLGIQQLNWSELGGAHSLPTLFEDKAFQEKIYIAFNYSCVSAMDSLLSVFNLAMEQEERNLKAKRVLNQQQVIKLQSDSGSSLQDVLAQLKTFTNQQLNQVEKGVLQSMEDAVRPQIGSFTKEVEALVDELESLDEEKGSKQTRLYIPDNIQRSFQESVSRFFQTMGQENLVILRDTLKGLEEEIEKILAQHELPAVSFNVRYLTDQPLQQIMMSAVRWERPYEGSLGRKGPYEYFMAMRKYQMIVFMLASSLGLSFLRNLRLYMIPVTILLLGVGGYNVYRSVEKERADNDSKELDKAKDSLKNEAKRIGSEVVRQWGKVIADHIKQQNHQILQTLESHLKEVGRKKDADLDEQKKRSQRQTQSLDSMERKYSNIQRGKETVYRGIMRSKSDIKQAFIRTNRNRS